MSKYYRAPRLGNNVLLAQEQYRQARVNAIIPKEAEFDIEGQQNLEGTLMLFYSKVKVLFDTSAPNSFIAFKLVQDLGLVP